MKYSTLILAALVSSALFLTSCEEAEKASKAAADSAIDDATNSVSEDTKSALGGLTQ